MRGVFFALASCLLCSLAYADSSSDSDSNSHSADDEPSSSVVVAMEELHPTIRSRSGGFTLEVSGFFQLDGRSVSWEDDRAGDVLIRRARAKAEGELLHFLEYELDVDLSERDEPVRDAYVNAVVSDGLQVRLGKGKLPFSQEELRSSRFLDFAERPAMNNLIPDRSLGVEVHGELLEGRLAYQTGLFGVAAATSGGRELLARLRVRPFGVGALERLAVGGAIGRGSMTEGESFEGRPGSRSFTFFEPIPISGGVAHDNVEAAWFYRNVSLHAEWIHTGLERRGSTAAPDVDGRGLEIGGAWILTGEAKGERGVAPRRPVFAGGPGAWEVVARYEQLEIDEGTAIHDVRAFVVGTNWWLSRSLRFVLNVSLDRFENPLNDAPATGARALLARVQVIF